MKQNRIKDRVKYYTSRDGMPYADNIGLYGITSRNCTLNMLRSSIILTYGLR